MHQDRQDGNDDDYLVPLPANGDGNS